MYRRILDLETQLDARLTWPRVTSTFKAARNLAELWSAAVWRTAEFEGPLTLTATEISTGLELGARPVFVCGVHRSGTTLMRDLLDGHPALAVLPSEGAMFTNLEGRLRRLHERDWLGFVGCEWLRRLANPIYQHPYWLLGRSQPERSPYVNFARALLGWWPIASEHLKSYGSWPLIAVALAYAQVTQGLTSPLKLRRWVEKTPNNECFFERLRLEFPGARLIQMVRHPFAVLASHRQGARNANVRLHGVKHILEHLELSYRLAAGLSSSFYPRGYLLVRYEDLLARTGAVMERVAAFLDIEPLPSLLQPTANDQPALSNTAFWSHQLQPGLVHSWAATGATDALSRLDRERVSALLGEAPAMLGYELPSVAPRRRRLLHLATRVGI